MWPSADWSVNYMWPSAAWSVYYMWLSAAWSVNYMWPSAAWSVYYMWPSAAWSVNYQSMCTNNDLEGWHNRLNARSHAQVTLYMLVSLMHKESGMIQI